MPHTTPTTSDSPAPDERPVNEHPVDERGGDPQRVTVTGVDVQIDAAAAPAATGPATVTPAHHRRSAALRTAVGHARRAATVFTPSPYRPGDGGAAAQPLDRTPRSMRAAALIAGLVVVSLAFGFSIFYHSNGTRHRQQNPAGALVGAPNDGSAGAIPAPLTPSVFSTTVPPSGAPASQPARSKPSSTPHAGGGAAAGGVAAADHVHAVASPAPAKPSASTAPATSNSTPTYRIVGHWQGLCIDVPNFNGVPGQRLQVARCNGLSAQNWIFPGDGTIRIYGLCMDVAGGSTASGTPIQLARCNGGSAQRFDLNKSYDLVALGADKCVDITDWGGDGTPLQLWTCRGTTNQKWDRR